jgi:hypothetical protein
MAKQFSDDNGCHWVKSNIGHSMVTKLRDIEPGLAVLIAAFHFKIETEGVPMTSCCQLPKTNRC